LAWLVPIRPAPTIPSCMGA